MQATAVSPVSPTIGSIKSTTLWMPIFNTGMVATSMLLVLEYVPVYPVPRLLFTFFQYATNTCLTQVGGRRVLEYVLNTCVCTSTRCTRVRTHVYLLEYVHSSRYCQ